MKHTDLKRAVKNTASVLAALLLMGMLTGCFGLLGPKPNKPNEPVQPQKVIITVKGDEGVIVKEPKTIEVAEGKKWSEVKNNVNVSYKDGYKAKGFKMDSESGLDLDDRYIFYQNKTVFAISKKIPRPNDPDLFKTDGNGVITGYTCDKEDLPKSLVIPAKIGDEVITKIEQESFRYCGLTNLDLSACTGLTEIGYRAFEGCTKLTELKLPASLTKIDYMAFKDCPIETLYIGCDIKGTIIPHLTQEASIKEHLKNLILEEGVTIINFYNETTGYYPKTYYAFKDCSNLTGTIVFPASLKTIEESAFEGCTKLQGIDFSKCTELTEINYNAFSGCTNLTGTIVFPASLKTIKKGYLSDQGAFKGCTKLQGVDFSKCTELTEIDYNAFSGCTGLTSLDLSFCTKLTSVSGFAGCTGLMELKLPASLTGIGSAAFKGCTKLTELKLPASLTKIDYRAFEDCPIETLYIGCDIKDSIIENLTQEASVKKHLKNLILEEGVTRIDFYDKTTGHNPKTYYAFEDCSNLTGTIVFPASLKTIKTKDFSSQGAFKGCTKLQGIDFSKCTEFTKIEENTFYGCTGLMELKLPKRLTQIGRDAFKDCPIETLYIGCDIKGSIVNNLTQEASVKEHLKNLILEEGLTKIDQGEYSVDAFVDCHNLTGTIVFPASLISIEIFVFRNCTKLQGADFSKCAEYKYISTGVFENCKGLTELKLPENIISIGNEAFSGCPGLTEVKLPKSLTKIYNNAFSNQNLAKAIFEDTNGWAVYSDWDFNNKYTDIAQIDLADPAKAANYLHSSYRRYNWKKN